MTSIATVPTSRGLRRAAATSLVLLLGATGALSACSEPQNGAGGEKIGMTFLVKGLSAPYWASMADAAKAAADKDGVDLHLQTTTGTNDAQTQISQIENAVSRGDKAIIIAPVGDAVNPALQRAKAAGTKIVVVDTPLNPVNLGEATYATDNFAAGKLIGEWTAATLNGRKALIALLDNFSDQVQAGDSARDRGFLTGMGIDPKSTTAHSQQDRTGRYSKGDYEIVCQEATNVAVDLGRTAMEKCLSLNPDLNVVYTVSEDATRGAAQAIDAAGKKDGILVTAIDGGCKGLDDMKSGKWQADSMQYPAKMAEMGLAAAVTLVNGGTVDPPTKGLDFIDTGVTLVTNQPAAGIPSQTIEDGLKECWG